MDINLNQATLAANPVEELDWKEGGERGRKGWREGGRGEREGRKGRGGEGYLVGEQRCKARGVIRVSFAGLKKDNTTSSPSGIYK